MLIVGAKTGFGQNCHKMDIFYYMKSQKSSNPQDVWFSHRFSTLGPKVTPMGPPDGLGLTLAVQWSRTIRMVPESQ